MPATVEDICLPPIDSQIKQETPLYEYKYDCKRLIADQIVVNMIIFKFWDLCGFWVFKNLFGCDFEVWKGFGQLGTIMLSTINSAIACVQLFLYYEVYEILFNYECSRELFVNIRLLFRNF